MKHRKWLGALLVVAIAAACGGGETDGDADDVQISEDLGTLRVENRVDEPVTIYLDGTELYSVPPASAFVFRNLPTREVSIYGVGRVTEKHYGLPKITIEEGEEYEWTIRP